MQESTELTAINVELPAVGEFTEPMLEALTRAMGVGRDVLASQFEIHNAWHNLPNLLTAVPPDKRDQGIVKMCVAVACGLFDSALNYVWNAAILELRDKVRRFGIHIVPQIIDRDFDEQTLSELQDSELLRLCLKLNLISETGYFMLDQCRDIRNNFSAAHPAMGSLNEYEFLNFLNRCGQHALREDRNSTGVDYKAFMNAINAGSFSAEQMEVWCDRITRTFDAQREAIIKMLHGIYCDPKKKEHARITAFTICNEFAEQFTPGIISELVNQHEGYRAKGDESRAKASRGFFESLALLGLLSESERHSMISAACKDLMTVHYAMNNFYNERPFAERLASLSRGHQVPQTVQEEFVEAIATCSVGNEYGTAHTADPIYVRMIQGFSRREVVSLLSLPEQRTVVGSHIKSAPRCKAKFREIVGLLQVESVPTKMKSTYENWLQV